MQALGPLIIDIDGTTLTAEDEQILKHPLVGGVILFTRNFESVTQLEALVRHIKQLRTPTLMISVDHEGGRIQRFSHGFSALPSLGRIGQYYEQEPMEAMTLAATAGWLMASELKAVGVDVSYAPVLDLDRRLNTVIGDRSFHQTPTIVAKLAAAYIEGMNQAGMLAIGKHFPGHGGVTADSHVALPIDERSMALIDAEDLSVFRRLIALQCLGGIMPAHVCYTAIDDMPTTFSSYWLKEILRQQLGFKGLIFSDDISMQGAAIAGDYSARLRKALAVGCDMVLLCNQRAEVKTVLATCSELAQDLSEKIQPFTTRVSDNTLLQLQQTPRWQSASEIIKEFREQRLVSSS